MKIIFKQFFIVCSILFLFVIPVKGLTVSSDGEVLGDFNSYTGIFTESSNKVSDLESALRNEYAEKLKNALQNKESNMDLIARVTISDSNYLLNVGEGDEIPFSEKYPNGFSLASSDEELSEIFNGGFSLGNNVYNTTKIKMTLIVDDISYDFYFCTKYMYEYRDTGEVDENGDPIFDNILVPKSDRFTDYSTGGRDSVTYTKSVLTLQEEIGEATEIMMKRFSKAVKLGLIAGSVGSSYNVGTVYSTSQRPLSDIMERSNGGYDFKDSNSMKTSFSYFMNPLLGRVDFIEKSVPKTLEEWTEFVGQLSFIQDTTVSLNTDYVNFNTELSEERVNNQGLKIASDLIFRNGVSAIKDIALSENPKSVISYNLHIAVPYIFRRVGENYTLDKTNLRILEEYTYCVWNDKIYDSAFNEITNRSDLKIPRDNLYLFCNYNIDSQPVGIVLVGYFNECVVDTSGGEDNTGMSSKGYFFDTGRQIGFTNGYSDSLFLNKANKNLMFVVGASGKENFLPLNVAFPVDEIMSEELKLVTYTSFAERLVWEENNPGKPLPDVNKETRDDLKNFVQDGDNHIPVGENPKFFKIMIDLVETKNFTGEKKASEDAEEAKTSRYAFVILRNNRYVNDSSLINWLKTDLAQSMPYVDAITLLERITGDFVSGLDKLSYLDWLRMQDIRTELQHEKDTWLIRAFNVMSIVMGTTLIIFGLLICIFYWFDIFNTLTDFSILYVISLGNLYPISSDDMEGYMQQTKGDVKYVTFKNVVVIAFISCLLGLFFIESQNIINVVIWTYQYIMDIIGRLSL